MKCFCTIFQLSQISGRSDTRNARNLRFRFGKCGREKMGLRQVEQGFASFFAKFDDFSKWTVLKELENFEKSSNMPKKISKK